MGGARRDAYRAVVAVASIALHDIGLHLTEVKAYKSGIVELCDEVGEHGGGPISR